MLSVLDTMDVASPPQNASPELKKTTTTRRSPDHVFTLGIEEELQTSIKTGSGSLAKTQLLSVTLDPTYDTPKVLSDYAAFHHADPRIWTFATGDEKDIDSLTRAFSVYRQTEGGTISHGLATALVNRDGVIERIWRGNAWTPAEVTEAIQAGNK